MDATPTHPPVLAVVDDLMLSSRVSTAAKGAGVEVKFTRSVDAVLSAARATPPPALVILDLNSARTKPLEIIAALKADASLAGIATVGFVSHVDTTTIEAARRAGVDRVLARSAFVEQLPQLLLGGRRG